MDRQGVAQMPAKFDLERPYTSQPARVEGLGLLGLPTPKTANSNPHFGETPQISSEAPFSRHQARAAGVRFPRCSQCSKSFLGGFRV